MKKRLLIAAVLVCSMLSGCGDSIFTDDAANDTATNISSKASTLEDEDLANNSGDDLSGKGDYSKNAWDNAVGNNSGSASSIDYKKLGVTKTEYGDTFQMGDNLKTVLRVICYPSYTDGKWDNSMTESDANWKKTFINSYLQNSWCGYDYLTNIMDNNNGIMSKEQVEYVQYSLTGKYIEFNDLENGEINIKNSSSGFGDGEIRSYNVDSYNISDNTIKLTLKYAVYYEISSIESGDADATFDVSVVLNKDPYSCFDGYNIVSIEKTETTPKLSADNKTHYISGDILDIDEDKKVIMLEYPYGDDAINGNSNFGHSVNIDCSEHPELIDTVKSIKDDGYYLVKVGFIFDNTVSTPFSTVKGTSVEGITK